jgi:hypothetical protein
VLQDLLDHRPLLDRGHEAQAAAAIGASQNVELERAAEKVSPRVMAGAHVGGRQGVQCGQLRGFREVGRLPAVLRCDADRHCGLDRRFAGDSGRGGLRSSQGVWNGSVSRIERETYVVLRQTARGGVGVAEPVESGLGHPFLERVAIRQSMQECAHRR